MKIEHVAWQVADPVAVADWYVEHLGFVVKRRFDDGARARFLADDSGAVMLEVYHNAAAPMPDYPATDPLVLHLALRSDHPDADAERLVATGATLVEGPFTAPNDDRLAMLRDPWGFPLQLCRRAEPMI